MSERPAVIDLDEDHRELREPVAALCARYPGEYWREKDRERAYPEEFVQALTDAGFLAALIPERYGGSGLGIGAAGAILEEIHASGCNGGACHAQMYTMGTVLRHGSDAQKEAYLPQIASGARRLQAFGVTEPTTGSDTTQLRTTAERRQDGDYTMNGQKVWISRAEHSDLLLLLARTTPKEECARRTDGLSVFLIELEHAVGNGLEIRPIRTMINHATTELFFDDLVIPGASLIGEEGRGFRYILDGMNAERILIAAECIGDCRWFIEKASAYASERQVFGRPIGANQGGAVPHRRGLRTDGGRKADGEQGRRAVRRGPPLRARGQHGEAAGVRGLVEGRRHLPPDPRRLRLRRGIRRGAQVPRDPALPRGADLHQPHPRLPRPACARHAALLLSASR